MQYRKVSLTLLIAVLGYKLMATALPLMNKPSDAALYGGAALLVLSLVATFIALRLLWSES